MRAIKILFAFTFFIFVFAGNCQAVTVSIVNFPSSISDQPFVITASVSGATAGTNYLRIDLYKDGTSNYFGETYNGNSWYSGGDGTQYFPITIDSSKTGSGTFQGLVGTPNSNDYPGPGSYKLRIRRYTSQSSYGSDTETPVDVNITYSSPTPSPTLTVTPAPTDTTAPTPTNSPTLSLTPTKKSTPTPTSAQSKEISATDSSVLGESAPSSSTPQVKDENVDVASASENILPKIFIGLGILFILACLGLIIYPNIQKLREEKFGNGE